MAEVPGALVAVLIAAAVIPGRAEWIGDRLVVLVAGDVERRVGVVTIGALTGATRSRDIGGVGHVRVQSRVRTRADPAVVGAVGAVCAARAVAAAHAPRRE